MRQRLILVLLLVTALPVLAFAGDDHERARELMEQGRVMPLQQLLQKASSDHAWQLLEVELEEEGDRVIYEIDWLDDQGKVLQIKYDATTGEVLSEKDKGKR